MLGLTQLEAEATSLLAIIPVAILGSWRQTRAGEVRWRDAAVMGLVSVGTAIAGAFIADAAPDQALRIGFALLLVATAVQLVLRERARDALSASRGRVAKSSAEAPPIQTRRRATRSRADPAEPQRRAPMRRHTLVAALAGLCLAVVPAAALGAEGQPAPARRLHPEVAGAPPPPPGATTSEARRAGPRRRPPGELSPDQPAPPDESRPEAPPAPGGELSP